MHALFHGIGFMVAFELAKPDAFSGHTLVPMSVAMRRVAGVAWLIAGGLFVVAVLSFWMQKAAWWNWGFAGVVLSQLLIGLYWRDAWAGTLPNVLLLLLFAWAMAHQAFGAEANREAERLRAQVGGSQPVVITAGMLDTLPVPIQRHLREAGVVGQPIAQIVRLTQTGTFLVRPGWPRMQFNAEQTFTVQPVGFVWRATMRWAGIPLFQVRDSYQMGHGRMVGRLGSALTVVDQTGPEMDEGALMRFLSEMVWFPTAFLSPNVSFETIDARSVRVSLTDHGRCVSATMHFGGRGVFTGMTSQRYREHDGTFSLDSWYTPALSYEARRKLRIPTQGSAIWKLKEGDLNYIDVNIGEVVSEP